MPPMLSASCAGRARSRPGSRSGSARRRPGTEVSARGRTRALAQHGDRVVQRLHDQQDDHPLGPLARDRACREQRRRRAAARARTAPSRCRRVPPSVMTRVQQPHRVAALAVAHRLDVRVLVRVPRRGDRHALRCSRPRGLAMRTPSSASEFVRVSSPSRAEMSGRRRGAQLVQQLLGVVGAGAEHHLVGGERPAGRGASHRAGALGVDRVAAAGQRPDAGARWSAGAPAAPRALGQREVVRGQGVLRAVPAAGHALAALDAAGARRPGAAEVRIGDRRARFLARRRARRTPRPGVGRNVSPLPNWSASRCISQVARRGRGVGRPRRASAWPAS